VPLERLLLIRKHAHPCAIWQHKFEDYGAAQGLYKRALLADPTSSSAYHNVSRYLCPIISGHCNMRTRLHIITNMHSMAGKYVGKTMLENAKDLVWWDLTSTSACNPSNKRSSKEME
jgi:hypothetical protein